MCAVLGATVIRKGAWTVIECRERAQRGALQGMVGFRLRFRIFVGKPLTSKETSLALTFDGRAVEIKSQIKDQPLSETNWIVFMAKGFSTSEEAMAYGERLRVAAEIAAFSTRLGTNTGQDKPSGMISEAYARSIGAIKDDERIAPNIHGLLILPDDEKTRIQVITAHGTVTADPASFVHALETSANNPIKTESVRDGLRVFNLALMSQNSLAQVVLAFSAIEAFGQDEKWTLAQVKLIQSLAAEIETTAGDDSERLEVAEALLRNVHRVGLRQGVVRVLDRIGQLPLKKEWDRLYGLRSGVFHGTSPLSEPETAQMAADSITLCGKILIALLEKEGVVMPDITKIHFN
jgi:hypothetical protein